MLLHTRQPIPQVIPWRVRNSNCALSEALHGLLMYGHAAGIESLQREGMLGVEVEDVAAFLARTKVCAPSEHTVGFWRGRDAPSVHVCAHVW
jgi:hypothetical protein